MKSLLLPLAACAALAGCVGYGDAPVSYGYPGVYQSGIYQSGVYSTYPYGGVYSQPGTIYSQPGAIYSQPAQVYQDGRGMRDRDRDGIPNRLDDDRDGDGVRNRDDAYPNNPRRR